MADDPRELEVGMVVKIVTGGVEPHVDGDVGVVVDRSPTAMRGTGAWIAVPYRKLVRHYYYSTELEILSHE